MEKINLLAALTQQISELMNEMEMGGCQIISVRVDTIFNKSEVHLTAESFLENITEFQVKSPASEDYKFRMSKVMNGVEFFAVTNDSYEIKKAYAHWHAGKRI